nr:hypothetical protein [Tanacetum cinerariifolium]
MPPRRLKKKSVKRLVEKRVAKAIEEYEKTRANLDNARSSGGNSENVGGLNVHTLGLVNANRIPWIEFKSMMTTEYCPTTKIQRMEQELWTLTLKGDDIEAYNNRFHDLDLMCPNLVPNEKKKQNQRQETAKAYIAALAKGRGYARNLPSYNRCKAHHHPGPCPPREKGHYRDKCPRGRKWQNEGARGRAYLMRTKEPQQDPNVIAVTASLSIHLVCSRQLKSGDQSSLREIDCEISFCGCDTENASAPDPPVRSDDQILPYSSWVPIGRSNCVLGSLKKYRNPIYKISINILQNTNFFGAFTATTTIPTLYIQQFWDTIRHDKKTRVYSCQLDERRFKLNVDVLREALGSTPRNEANQFVPPVPNNDLIDFVLQLGYPKDIGGVSYMPRHLVVQMLWAIITQTNVDFAKLLWEEFIYVIDSFITDKKKLSEHITDKKKEPKTLLIPYVRFTKLIIFYLKSLQPFHPRTRFALHILDEDSKLGNLKFVTKGVDYEIFEMPILDALITDDIRNAPYYSDYLELVEKHNERVTAETAQEKKHKLVKETPNEPSPAKRSKESSVTKMRKTSSPPRLVDEFADEGVPVIEPRVVDKEADFQRVMEESLKEQRARNQGPARTVVIREPDFRRIQLLQKRRTPESTHATGPSKTAGSPSVDAEFALSDNQTESDVAIVSVEKNTELEATHTEIPETTIGKQDEGHGGLNTEPASSTRTLSSLHQLDKDFTLRDQYINDKSSDAKKEKTRAEEKVESMVTVTIQQDTSTVPPRTFTVVELPRPRPDDPNVHSPLLSTALVATPTTATTIITTATITTTTTSTIETPTPLLLPPQPPQSNPNLESHLEEVYTQLTNVVQANLDLEERLIKQNFRLSELEHQDLLTEILYQWMFEDNSYQAHVDHKNLFEAPEKSIEHDHSDQLLEDLAEAQRKHKKRRDSPRTPSGSPPPQPPPPPPPSGASGAPGWWKPLTKDERPAMPEPAWTIPSSNLSDCKNNWATALVFTYAPHAESSLLTKTGPAYELVKVFHPNVVHLQFQLEECHKLPTDQMEDALFRVDISRSLPLSGPPGHVTIQSDFFFNKALNYLRYGSKGCRPALSILKMKVAYYPDFGLEQMVPEQMWIESECIHTAESGRKAVRTYMRILSVVRIETRNLVIRQSVGDFQLGIESYQSQLNLTKPRWDATGFELKHNYTIIDSPRSVTLQERNDT